MINLTSIPISGRRLEASLNIVKTMYIDVKIVKHYNLSL